MTGGLGCCAEETKKGPEERKVVTEGRSPLKIFAIISRGYADGAIWWLGSNETVKRTSSRRPNNTTAPWVSYIYGGGRNSGTRGRER